MGGESYLRGGGGGYYCNPLPREKAPGVRQTFLLSGLGFRVVKSQSLAFNISSLLPEGPDIILKLVLYYNFIGG